MKNKVKRVFCCVIAIALVICSVPFSATATVSSNIAITEAKYNTKPEASFVAKTGATDVYWSGSTAQEDYAQYHADGGNILYWPSAYDSTVTTAEISTNRLQCNLYYPTCVLLWDGTNDTYLPIMSYIGNTQSWLVDPNRTIFFLAPYDYDRGSAASPADSSVFDADIWRGIKDAVTEDYNWCMYHEDDVYTLESTVGTATTENKFNYGATYKANFASRLRVTNPNFIDNNGYSAAHRLWWTTNSLDKTAFNVEKDNNSVHASNTVYIINYKALIDCAQSAVQELQDFVPTDYTPTTVNAYYSAIETLFSFDPNSYFNMTDGKTAAVDSEVMMNVNACAGAIKSAVDAYNNAKANLSKQYRISFTNAQGTLLMDNYYNEDAVVTSPTNTPSAIISGTDCHYNREYHWDADDIETATESIDYVETYTDTPQAHNFGAYTKGIKENDVYYHSQVCADCNYVNKQACTIVTNPATTKPETCVNNGVNGYKCAVCQFEYTTAGNAASGNHIYSVLKQEKINPTCTEFGTEAVYQCETCTKTIGGTQIPKGDHSYKEVQIVAPTCTEQGYTEVMCKDCGATAKKDFVSPTGHQYTEINKTVVCSICGDTVIQLDPETPAPDGLVFVKTIAPTCKSSGYDLYRYNDGITTQYYYNNIKPKLQHIPTTDLGYDATCTTNGLSDGTHCSLCNTVLTEQTTIAATGHNYVEKNGKLSCSICGNVLSETSSDNIIESGLVLVETVAPTCTSKGYDLYKLDDGSIIEYFYANVKDPVPHTPVVDLGYKATCTTAGMSDGSHCSVCDKVLIEKAPIQPIGHKYTSTVVQPTVSAQGYTIHTCTGCGTSYKDSYTDKLTSAEDALSKIYGTDAETTKEINKVLGENNVSAQTAALTEAAMTTKTVKNDGDYAGSTFNLLRAQLSKATKNSIKIKWTKVKNADGYIVYGAKCGANTKYKKIATVSKNTTTFTHKKLKKGTYYKYNVVAYKNVKGKKVTLAASKKIHAITLGGKYGVAKSIKIDKIKGSNSKTKVTLKKGKSATIKASEVKKDKPIKRHRAICYESTNPQVATVNAKGKITAKKKGTCKIYIYAQNGVYKTVTVTVK